MTKFISIDKDTQEKKETVFTRIVDIENNPEIDTEPYEFDFVQFIGSDKIYGDVFKCWNKESEGFNIYFGTKGDEFN